VGAAISTSPESGLESSAPLLPSLDALPTLREMLGLPDRESSPEEVDDDNNNGLERLFWMPLDVERPSSGLRPSSDSMVLISQLRAWPGHRARASSIDRLARVGLPGLPLS
jgi:hypothetical protein